MRERSANGFFDWCDPDALFDAVVVGAGFSGLYMMYRLLGLGISVRGVEAGDDVGGTWYWNRYPGVRTDWEAGFYAYALHEEPAREEWSFTEKFPRGSEVQAYLGRIAERFDLRRHYDFRTTVVSAVYSDDASAGSSRPMTIARSTRSARTGRGR